MQATIFDTDGTRDFCWRQGRWTTPTWTLPVQKVKISDPEFTSNKEFGCSFLTTTTGTDNCGGVALLAMESYPCMVKEVNPWDPNVSS